MARTRTLAALTILAVAVTGLEATAAAERKVFLNGVDLSDTVVTDKAFTGCTVRFDADGNVHISVDGLKVDKKPTADGGGAKPPSRPAPPARLTNHYFLIAEESPAGATGFDIAVEVNGRPVTTVRSGDTTANAAVDITEYVKPGDNQVRLTANKRAAESRRSRSAQHQLKIMVGEGTVEGGTVTVTRTVLEYRRTAAETKTSAASYGFTAR